MTTRIFAVFGNPIKHSYSPTMHQLFAEQCGLDNFSYTKQLVELETFEPSVKAFFETGGKGLNITVPFKLEAFTLAQQHLTPRALAAGAVNTLWCIDHKIYGDNTDGIGLVKDIQRLGISVQGKSVLLIGAGGAARGALLPLIEAGCSKLHIANRTLDKAQALSEQAVQLAPSITCSYSGLSDITGQWDIIINASASSLSDTALPIPSHLFTDTVLVYDMLYTPNASTAFLEQAKMHGATYCTDGLGMLVYQGAEAFAIWNGCYPPRPEEVIERLRHELSLTKSTT